MVTAPIQTVNALSKSELNKNKKIIDIIPRSINRLFYGSFTRSIRTGFASILWSFSRNFYLNK